ncbi:MAG: hypothetical protein ABW292_13515 [Vicinamibacterales bacterium]
MEISILETPALTEVADRTLVRPFKIRGHVVLQAGYTVNYEMLLRNLSPDCRCIANVDIVSVHWLPEAESSLCLSNDETGTRRLNTAPLRSATIGSATSRVNAGQNTP